MSAPSIPNLLSLRGTGRGRGRGRGGGTPGGTSAATGSSHDSTIQGTDTDAALSRLSAVELGYLSDPFATLFTGGQPNQPHSPLPPPRRLPIINRGTYTRTTGIDLLVDSFLSSTDASRTRQILSLGAGTDTRAFRLFSSPSSHTNISYHEIDFPSIIARKQHIIQTSPSTLSSFLNQKPNPSNPLNSPPHPTSSSFSFAFESDGPSRNNNNALHLHPLDLRSFPECPLSRFDSLSSAHPTLIISECCLCYLAPATTTRILEHLGRLFPQSAMVIYEPILPHDPFGKMMVSNLAARGIVMPTLTEYPTQQSQEERLRAEGGFTEVRSKTIDRVWEDWVSLHEKERIDGLEGGLDEVEEWKLLAGHYLIAWGWRGSGMGKGLDIGVSRGDEGRDGDDTE